MNDLSRQGATENTETTGLVVDLNSADDLAGFWQKISPDALGRRYVKGRIAIILGVIAFWVLFFIVFGRIRTSP